VQCKAQQIVGTKFAYICLTLHLDCGTQNPAYTFSPDAMPFTPRNIIGYGTALPPLHAAVTILSASALSVDAPEFYPRNYQAFCKVSLSMYFCMHDD